MRCKEHGTLRVSLPWAAPLSRFTLSFEAFAVEVLKKSTVSGAAEILGLSWDEAFNIMNRTVDRARAVKAEKDEKAIAKGHKYMTLVYDITNRTVEYIAEGRGQETLTGFYTSLSSAQLAGRGAAGGPGGTTVDADPSSRQMSNSSMIFGAAPVFTAHCAFSPPCGR